MTLDLAAAQDHNGDEVRARTWSWASNVTTWLSIAVAGMIIVFIGLAIDAWRHNNGAEEESLLSLSNPGHLVAGIGLPVFPRTALTVAAGGVCLAAGVGLVSIRDRALRLVTLAALVVIAVAALATAATHETREDWRAAARIARAKTTARDTVVVLPARARAAFAYYAPEIRTSGVGRGEGVTVVVAGDPATAVAAARPFVAPPRYALLSEEPAGSRLVVQRWVRP